ncbi:tail fiber protein [Bacillus phage W.Ph.]|uniref:Gp17 n=1 Tax=Bacillus phage W.Ph. TaxID=764595 RepID=G9B1B8_9CAUD|nr:tail fiber protein [Bacillus phage W.Ph.]ADH03163.1 gp17 [Bacillus phage W.Ph.]
MGAQLVEPESGSPYQHNNKKRIELADVDKLTLADFGFTVDAVKMNHFGINVKDPTTGEYLPDSFYEAKIEQAIAQVEKILDIVIIPRYVEEHADFYRNDFDSYNFIRTRKRPVVQLEKMRMEYGGGTIFSYPTKWWRVYTLEGHIELLPTMLLSSQGQNLSLSNIYSGYPMISGIPSLVGGEYAPQLFHVEYVAGLLPPKRRGVSEDWELSPDLWTLVIKVALKEVLQQWGRLIVGAGIAEMTTQIDGVFQKINTTQSAMYGGASADIMQLDRDIDDLVKGLKSHYGINLGII